MKATWSALLIGLSLASTAMAEEPAVWPPATWSLPGPVAIWPRLESPRYESMIEADYDGSIPEELVREHKASREGNWGSVSSQVTVQDDRAQRDNPLPPSPWQTNESLRVNVLGPVYAFGEAGAGAATPPCTTVLGQSRGGLGCKVPPVLGTELQVRGGQSLSFSDRGAQPGAWFVELQASCPLPLDLGLEYQGTAIPALTTETHDRISQDLRLAKRLGKRGSVHIGAHHNWERSATLRGGLEGLQFYVGFELKRSEQR
jgi:hypothetical protein